VGRRNQGPGAGREQRGGERLHRFSRPVLGHIFRFQTPDARIRASGILRNAEHRTYDFALAS